MQRILIACLFALITSAAQAQWSPPGGGHVPPTRSGCIYNLVLPTLQNGQGSYLNCDSSGRQIIVGAGTAGSSTGGVLTVQGVASMTPFLANPGTAANWAIGATGSGVPANSWYNGINVAGTLRGWTGVNPSGSVFAGQVDLASVAGTTAVTGGVNGSLGVGGLATAGSAIAGNPVLAGGSDGTNARAISTDTGGRVAVNEYRGGTALVADACQANAKLYKPINNAGSSSNLSIITHSSSLKTYICSANIGPVGGAVNVALVEGTGSACASSTAGMAGGATAATGWQFAANGGLALGDGTNAVAATATGGDDVCLYFSTGVQVSGVVTYVQQ